MAGTRQIHHQPRWGPLQHTGWHADVSSEVIAKGLSRNAAQVYGHSSRSAVSSPSLSSHPSFWRITLGRPSISTPSDYAVVSASGSVSTPASSIADQASAASHPTPTTTSPEARPKGSAEQVLYPKSDGQDTNGIGSPSSSNSCQCTFPECTATPFQIQYLLNSHMNVHSDERPYFCTVEDCPQGPDG